MKPQMVARLKLKDGMTICDFCGFRAATVTWFIEQMTKNKTKVAINVFCFKIEVHKKNY